MTNDPQSPADPSAPRLIPAVTGAAKDLTSAIAEEAREVADLAADQAKALKEKVVDSGSEIRDWAAEGAQTVKDAARREGRAMRRDVDERVKRARERVVTVEEAAADYIRQKPFESILLAVGAGFILGWAARH